MNECLPIEREALTGDEKESDDHNPDINFHIEQYNSLRSEIFMHASETRKLEIYVSGSIAAIYAWLMKDGSAINGNAYYIPVAIVLLGSTRSIALYWRIHEISLYLRKIECLVLKDSPSGLKGWENFFLEQNRWVIGATAGFIWSSLLAITLIAPKFLLDK